MICLIVNHQSGRMNAHRCAGSSILSTQPVSEVCENTSVLLHHHDQPCARTYAESDLPGNVDAKVAVVGGSCAGQDCEWQVAQSSLKIESTDTDNCGSGGRAFTAPGCFQKGRTIKPDEICVDPPCVWLRRLL